MNSTCWRSASRFQSPHLFANHLRSTWRNKGARGLLCDFSARGTVDSGTVRSATRSFSGRISIRTDP